MKKKIFIAAVCVACMMAQACNIVIPGKTPELSAEALAFINAANALPGSFTFTLGDKEAVEAANALYGALSEQARAEAGVAEAFAKVEARLAQIARLEADGSPGEEEPPDGSVKLLIIGSLSDTAALTELLAKDDDVQAERIAPAQAAGKTQADLSTYDKVILMNVNPDELAEGFMTALDGYVMAGGGLLTTGGDNAYKPEYVTTGDPLYNPKAVALQKMLPVEFDPRGQPLALMLVIDMSSSMAIGSGQQSGSGITGYEPQYIGSRLWAAKEAAKAAVNALEPGDYAAVIGFKSSAQLAKDFTPVSRKAEIFAAIDGMTTAQGTIYNDATALASGTMATVDFTGRRHVMFLTDGVPTDAAPGGTYAFYNTIAAMNAQGVTFTTFGLGDEASNLYTRQVLQRMADLGGGDFYNVPDSYANRLQTYMVQEVERQKPQWKNTSNINVVIKSAADFLEGITALPNLGGYYGVRAKGYPGDPEDQVGKVLLAALNGSPLYAEWKYGAGRAASFMSDLGSGWSGGYFAEDSAGALFVLNMVKAV